MLNSIITKTVYLIIILVTLSITGTAQESQKGNFSISISGIPIFHLDHGYYGFVIKPGFEYGITDHLSIQNDFFYHLQTGLEIDGTDSKSSTYGIIPSLKYGWSINKSFFIFGQLGVGFGSVLYKKTEDNDFTYDVSNLNSGIIIYSLGAGISYRLSNTFGIELLIPYIYVDNITNSNNADVLFNGIGPTIGLKYTFINN